MFFLLSALAYSLVGDETKPAEKAKPLGGELFNNIRILMDLDAGNVEAARQRVNDDSMVRIFAILERLQFTTNSETLSSQPALRAAAKYWGKTNLPANLEIFPMRDASVSNEVHRALAIVSRELDKK